MKLLALDTSTEYLSLCLWLDGVAHTRNLLAGQSHSQQILPLLREILTEAKLELGDLDYIAFGAGPGSFTGLRIGCGVAQGLAFGANLPVVAVSTLQALAQGAMTKDPTAVRIIACLDARMGEVYHAAYIRNGECWDEISAPGLYKPEAIPTLPGEGWVGAGSGWSAYGDALKHGYAKQIISTMPEEYPNATAIAALSLPMFAAGLGVAAAQAAPIYIRNKVALKTSEREAGLRFN
ncbi:MAG TPA: tRNA (adenosine(37)-N6)-threonylcarbamoyltransferase complex dimerization subunit type 1 TsaB [Methylophilaceae bacterium]